MQIITTAEFMYWAFSNFRVQISTNKEIVVSTYIRMQYFTDIIGKFIHQGLAKIVTAAH